MVDMQLPELLDMAMHLYARSWGIRPAFYYHDDEIVVVASERPVIQTALILKLNRFKEVKPGHAVIIKKNGKISK